MILDTCTIVKCKAISSKYEKIKFVRASRYAGNIFHYIDIDEMLGQQFLGLIFYYLWWYFPPSLQQTINPFVLLVVESIFFSKLGVDLKFHFVLYDDWFVNKNGKRERSCVINWSKQLWQPWYLHSQIWKLYLHWIQSDDFLLWPIWYFIGIHKINTHYFLDKPSLTKNCRFEFNKNEKGNLGKIKLFNFLRTLAPTRVDASWSKQ